MYLKNVCELLYHPKDVWQELQEERQPSLAASIIHIAVLALIAPAALVLGSTQVGWSLNGSIYFKLSVDSAIMIGVSFYLAILAASAFIAWAIYWMEHTFGADASMERCVMFTAFTGTPLYLAGFAGLFPLLWVGIFVVLAAACYSVYLIYVGVPTFMKISEEQGFLFASSVLTVGLVVFVGMLTVTVLMWAMGFAPQLAS